MGTRLASRPRCKTRGLLLSAPQMSTGEDVSPSITSRILLCVSAIILAGWTARVAAQPIPSARTLVQDWDFGTSGTIRNTSDLDAAFVYHDQWGTIGNGKKYGALTVASSKQTAIDDPEYGPQPYEGQNDLPPVRTFTETSLRTALVALGDPVDPEQHNVLCGSFMAQWTLPNAGSRLG